LRLSLQKSNSERQDDFFSSDGLEKAPHLHKCEAWRNFLTVKMIRKSIFFSRYLMTMKVLQSLRETLEQSWIYKWASMQDNLPNYRISKKLNLSQGKKHLDKVQQNFTRISFSLRQMVLDLSLWELVRERLLWPDLALSVNLVKYINEMILLNIANTS
jgi:hypothetical protein